MRLLLLALTIASGCATLRPTPPAPRALTAEESNQYTRCKQFLTEGDVVGLPVTAQRCQETIAQLDRALLGQAEPGPDHMAIWASVVLAESARRNARIAAEPPPPPPPPRPAQINCTSQHVGFGTVQTVCR